MPDTAREERLARFNAIPMGTQRWKRRSGEARPISLSRVLPLSHRCRMKDNTSGKKRRTTGFYLQPHDATVALKTRRSGFCCVSKDYKVISKPEVDVL